ncbi:MAG: peptidylprolyl isomerase [Planctomycetes bacterium]|nr:peptidylprolyl isomerase [Planctomycetota bacterium]
MRRREWLCAVASSALIGCGSGPGKVKGEPQITKAPALPEDKKIRLASGEAAGAGENYRVKFETTAGNFVIEVHPDWAPLGAERFRELVESGFYDNCKFFRVVEGFMVQFGISGDPAIMDKWRDAKIQDDVVTRSNKKGFVTFATSGKNSRTTQVFINYGNNSTLDNRGFAPFGEVIEGMDVVERLYKVYGEAPSQRQDKIQQEGNAFLEANFPKLDSIKQATLIQN